MALLPESVPLPSPESGDLGRYLEDTITIDWQTPSVADCARRLLAGAASPADGLERIFHFVRDEIAHSFDLEPTARADSGPDEVRGEARGDRHATVRNPDPDVPDSLRRRGIACRASEVLALGHGICFAKSHLLAALARAAGHPTGFCYARLVDEGRPGRFVLHGFNAVFWSPSGCWIPLDARGDRAGIGGDCRFEPPFRLACLPDAERGELLLPVVYKRPARSVLAALERAPSLAALRRTLPDRVD